MQGNQNIIIPAFYIESLGVYVDFNLAMDPQAGVTLRSYYFHIRNVGRIINCIADGACITFVQLLIMSRLDCA